MARAPRVTRRAVQGRTEDNCKAMIRPAETPVTRVKTPPICAVIPVIESTNPNVQGFDGAALSFVQYLHELAR